MSEHQDSILFIGEVIASELDEAKTGQVYNRAITTGSQLRKRD